MIFKTGKDLYDVATFSLPVMIFKTGKEKVATSYKSLLEIPAIDIDGK